MPPRHATPEPRTARSALGGWASANRLSIMAEKLDPKEIVTLEELALSNMWETSALVELLERRGVLTRQDVLDMIRGLRQREPTGRPPR